MVKAGVTHDITLEDVDGSNRTGLMLARAKGRRGWTIGDRNVVAERTLTRGAMLFSEFPPDVEMNIVQHSWFGGVGGLTETRAVEDLSEIHFLADANKVDATLDGRLRPAQELRITTVDGAADAVRPSGFARVGTELWAFIGRDVYTWDFTNANWDIGTEPVAAANIYRNGVEYDGRTYVPSWVQSSHNPTRYIYKADADANWTRIGAGTGTQIRGAKFFAKLRSAGGSDVLYAAHVERADSTIGTHIIVSSTNPTSTSAWSTEVEIGESDSVITNMLTADDNELLIFKTNGIYTYDSAGVVVNRTPMFETTPHDDNFKVAFNWNGRILTTVNGNRLMELVLTEDAARYTYRNISLSNALPRLTNYHGQIVAIGGNTDFVFVVVHDSTNLNYYVLKGDLQPVGGVTDYRWHIVAKIAYTTSTDEDEAAVFLDGMTGASEIHDRLWIGVLNGGASTYPYFYPLSRIDTSWGYTNDTDCIAYSVKYDAGMPLIEKRWEAIDWETANLGSGGRQFAVAYRLDNETAWTTWTSVTASPYVTTAFPLGTSAKILEVRITFELSLVGTTAPEIITFRVKSQLRPDPTKLIPCEVYLAEHVRLLNGTFGGGTRTPLVQLRTWDAQAAELVLRTPDYFSPRRVVFMPGTYKEMQTKRLFGRQPEYHVTFALLDVGVYQDEVGGLVGDGVGVLWDESTWDDFVWS